MMLEQMKEFNKLSRSADFLSCTNDIVLSNKLVMIMQDLTDKHFNYEPFETYSFFSNINNILNQSSDPKSALVSTCVEVIHKSVASHNKKLKKIVEETNFLSTLIKLLFIQEDNDEKLIRLLTLIKDLLNINSELDEHHMKIFIYALRDHIEQSKNEKITKLSLNILGNLAMKNNAAKYLISRTIKAASIQEKVDKSSDLNALKYLIITVADCLPKDFHYFIKLCLKNIHIGVGILDIEPILHSLDILKFCEDMQLGKYQYLSEMEDISKMIDDLNEKLIDKLKRSQKNDIKEEFYDKICDFYSYLLKFDNKFASKFEEFTINIFEEKDNYISSHALKYFSSFINSGGEFASMDKLIASTIAYFQSFNEKTSSDQVGVI